MTTKTTHKDTCARCQAQDTEESAWSEREARERLHAAAPVLLEAAEAAEESLAYHYDAEGRYHETGVYGRNCRLCKTHDQLRVVIAAAKGEHDTPTL